MSIEMDRRTFLKIAAVTAGGAALAALRGESKQLDPTFRIEFDGNDDELSFEESTAIAERMDNLYDKLPVTTSHMTTQDVEKWVLEIAPMFEYNHIVPHARMPNTAGFLAYMDGDRHNHVLGQSNCDDYIRLNFRFSNEHSSWYEDEDAVFTTIHELAHVQQGPDVCAENSVVNIENSAQIAALEVAAQLGDSGNKQVFYSLVSELRNMAMATAWGMAIRTNRMPDYLAFRKRLAPGALAQSRFDKALRRWKGHEGDLMELIKRYDEAPLVIVTKAIRKNDSKVEGLAFPPVYGEILSIKPERQPIILDDLKYFFDHAEDIADDLYAK